MAATVAFQPSNQLAGNFISEVIDSVGGVVTGFLDTVTGQKAAREALAAQQKIAEAQAQRLAAQTESRAEATEQLFKALPFIAIGLGGIVILAIVFKKK